MDDKLYDCIIVGAGPAGLSAALFLARYCHSSVIFHHNSPRNIYSHGVHGFLGHHGILPTELLARGRDEVRQHGGLIVEACVTHIQHVAPEHFRVVVDDWQSYGARRLLLATGLRDLTPDCEGFREFYGRSVFHCPDCDGYEVAGKRVVVLGRGKKTVGFTLGLLTWTSQLQLVTNAEEDEMNEDERTRLADFGIPILKRRIASLEGQPETGQLERVRFAEGDALECDALFFNLGTEPSSNLHTLLGCQLEPESGLVRIDHEQRTTVPHVYAAGDLTPRSQLAVVAAAEGAMAAIHLHKSLLPPERRV